MKRLLYAAGLVSLILTSLFVAGPTAGQRPKDEDETYLVTVNRNGHSQQARVLKEAPDSDEGRPAWAGSLIVKFREGASAGERDESHRQAGALKTEGLNLRNAERVQVGQARVAQALAAYRSRPDVEYAESDRIVRAILTPNDPSFGLQWGMTKINAPQAWNLSLSSGATRIAVLDCGVFSPSSAWGDANGFPDGHPDVGLKVVSEANFSTSDNVDDFCDHGTHVAGIAAAISNNGIGVAGVGYDASIVNVKVLGDDGRGSDSSIINGILWAAGCNTNPCGDRRAEVINMSLGYEGSCSLAVQDAINKAWQQGLVIVAAAGNDGANGSLTPGNCNNVISVAASAQNDAKASFSNFGTNVDVAAPGVGILSTNYEGGYSLFDGTSMASPHVAGLAALVWTTSYNTGTPASVVNRILGTANKNALAGSVNGRINAAAAVGAATALLITTQPSGAVNNVAFTGQPVVRVVDSGGNTVTTDSSTVVTVAIASGGGTLSTTLTATASSGIATFSGLKLVGTAGNRRLIFISGSLTSVTSASFALTFSAAPGNTGWRNCGANTAVTSGSGDNNGFEVNAGNACINDSLFARDDNSSTNTNTSCTNTGKDRHVYSTYGMPIGSTATVQGIEIRLDAWVDAASSTRFMCVQLSWDGGTNWTTAKTTASLTASQLTYTLGSATDTWGRTWTGGQLSNGNFRVRVTNVSSSTSRDFRLDYVGARVTFTP